MSATAAGLFGTTSVTTTPVSDFRANSRFKSGVRSCTSTPNEVLLLCGGGVAAGGGGGLGGFFGRPFLFFLGGGFFSLRPTPGIYRSHPLFFLVFYLSFFAQTPHTPFIFVV